MYRYLREITVAIANHTGRSVNVTLGREPFAPPKMCTRSCPECDLSSPDNPLRVHMFEAERIFNERMTKAMCRIQQNLGTDPVPGITDLIDFDSSSRHDDPKGKSKEKGKG